VIGAFILNRQDQFGTALNAQEADLLMVQTIDEDTNSQINVDGLDNPELSLTNPITGKRSQSHKS
jgi:hypothetical protein